MAPEKNLSEQSKLQKLNERRNVIKVQAAKKHLTVVLKKNPDLWVKFWEDAQTMGYDAKGATSSGKRGTLGSNTCTI